MTKRSFDDAFWGDPAVQELTKDAKMLFLYLWTNKRCNSAGLYEITPKTICFDTGLNLGDLPQLFSEIGEKVKWLPEQNIVWVKNFLKHQPKSPLFLKSVADCLPLISPNGIVQEFVDYYSKLGVCIPFTNGIDMVSKHYAYQPEQEQEHIHEQELEQELYSKGGNSKKFPPEYLDFRKQVFAGLKTRRGYTSKQPAAEAGAINKLLSEGFKPDDILRAYDIMKAQPFWLDKNLSLMKVRVDINEVLKNGANRQNTGTKPGQTPRKYTLPDELRHE